MLHANPKSMDSSGAPPTFGVDLENVHIHLVRKMQCETDSVRAYATALSE